MTTVRLLILLIAVCFAGVADAQTPWSVPGSTCIPIGASAPKVRVNLAAVDHASTATGPIFLNCQIERFDSGASQWALALMYRDSTGTNASAGVVAQIFSLDTNPSSLSATPVLVTTVSSNSSNIKDTNNTVFSLFTHTFNFEANTYFARVILTRAATNQTVILHSLKLQVSFIPSDFRLKHDIALLGHLDNGMGFYRFSYNGSDKAYVGVMAQEVETIVPDAVVRGEDGYLRVAYERLGLRLQSWEEWVAAGQKIPATAPLAR